MMVDDKAEAEQVAAKPGDRRDNATAAKALSTLEADARSGKNIWNRQSLARMLASLPANGAKLCARSLAEFRAPTGVARAAINQGSIAIEEVRRQVNTASQRWPPSQDLGRKARS